MPKYAIKPFPSPLKVGIDICYIPRIERILTKGDGQWIDAFARRMFAPTEQKRYYHLYNEYKNVTASGNYAEKPLRELATWVAGR